MTTWSWPWRWPRSGQPAARDGAALVGLGGEVPQSLALRFLDGGRQPRLYLCRLLCCLCFQAFRHRFCEM